MDSNFFTNISNYYDKSNIFCALFAHFLRVFVILKAFHVKNTLFFEFFYNFIWIIFNKCLILQRNKQQLIIQRPMKTVKNLFAKALAVIAIAFVCIASFSSCDDSVIITDTDVIIVEDTIPLSE